MQASKEKFQNFFSKFLKVKNLRYKPPKKKKGKPLFPFRRRSKEPEVSPLASGSFTVADILAPSSADFNNKDYVVKHAPAGSTPDGRNTDFDKATFTPDYTIKIPVNEASFNNGPSGWWSRLCT